MLKYQYLKKIKTLTLGLALIMVGVAGAYDINMQFVVPDPSVLPIGRIIPDGVTTASDIQFSDIDPFFTIFVTGTGDDSLYLFVNFETEGRSIFTASSNKFPIATTVLNRWLNNHELAQVPEIRLGEGSEQLEASLMFPHMNGALLREGFYTLTVVLSHHEDWATAQIDNQGARSLPIIAHNVEQVQILSPENGVQLRTNPIFLWGFPRRLNVRMRLEVASGAPDADGWSVIESANEANRYLDTTFVINEGNHGGDFGAHVYTGVGRERPLDPGLTYFWRITAVAPSMFEDYQKSVSSPVNRFSYVPGGDDGAGGGGGGGAGGGSGGGSGGSGGGGLFGGQEGGGGSGGGAGGGAGGLGGTPAGGVAGSGLEGGSGGDPEPPVIGILRNALPEELFNIILSQIGNVSDYRLANIMINGQNRSLNELAAMILTGQIQIQSVGVSQ